MFGLTVMPWYSAPRSTNAQRAMRALRIAVPDLRFFGVNVVEDRAEPSASIDRAELEDLFKRDLLFARTRPIKNVVALQDRVWQEALRRHPQSECALRKAA